MQHYDIADSAVSAYNDPGDCRFFYFCRHEEFREVFWLSYGEYRGKRNVRLFRNYVLSRLKAKIRRDTWETYISDSLYAQGDGKRLLKRFSDILDSKPEDNRTGKEIADDVIKRIGLIRTAAVDN